MDYLHTISYQTKYNISPTFSQSGNTPHISVPLGISTLIPMLLIFASHKNKIVYLPEKGEGCKTASVFPSSGSPDFWVYRSVSYCFFGCKVQQKLSSFFTRHHYFHWFFLIVYSIKEHYHRAIIPLYKIKQQKMALNIPGLVSLSAFFTLTLATGIWASWKSRKDQQNRNPTEMAMVGGRNIHVFIGLFTATGKLS